MDGGKRSPRFFARVFAAPHQWLTDESFVILRGGSTDEIAAENACSLKAKTFRACEDFGACSSCQVPCAPDYPTKVR
jgi:hypothetical protein